MNVSSTVVAAVGFVLIYVGTCVLQWRRLGKAERDPQSRI
jgi:hypothetical protein